MKYAFLRWFFYYFIALVYRVAMPYKVLGRENIPDVSEGPFMIVANHFSYFEVALIGLNFPLKKIRAFASPDTLGEFGIIDAFYKSYEEQIIYVRRGTADRDSLKAGIKALKDGLWVLIFPEGSVTEESLEVANRGESTSHLQGGYYTRESGQLIKPRSGSALMAIQTQTPVIPVAFWGTEKVEGNIRRFRRTRITMHIGKPLPPFKMPDGVRGRERRAYMDDAAEQIMQAIADLMPEEHRGPYA